RWARNVETIRARCIVMRRLGGEGLEAPRRFAFIGLPLAIRAERCGDRVEQASARGSLRRIDSLRDHDVEQGARFPSQIRVQLEPAIAAGKRFPSHGTREMSIKISPR